MPRTCWYFVVMPVIVLTKESQDEKSKLVSIQVFLLNIGPIYGFHTTWRIRQLQVAAEVSALVLAIDGGSTEVSWPKQLVHRCFPLRPALKFWCPHHVS